MGAKFEATQKEVKEVEKDFLVIFQEIRETMIKQGGGGSTSGASSSKEMEALKQETEMLKAKNAKLEYRVQHMLKSMEELYNQQPKS